MSPEQLLELGELLSTAPERFADRFSAISHERVPTGARAGSANHPERGLRFSVYTHAARRSCADPGAGGGEDSAVGAGIATLLAHAGAGAAFMQAYLANVQLEAGESVPDWIARAAAKPVLASPVDQALACLRVLNVNQESLDAATLLSTEEWIRHLASARLHELLLDFPVLMHPHFVYDWQGSMKAGRDAGPMLQSIFMAGATLPSEGASHAPPSQQEALRAWATHPAVTLALTTPAPGLRRADVDDSPFRDELFLSYVTKAATTEGSHMSAAFLESLLALDRMRWEARQESEAHAPVEAPEPLAGLRLRPHGSDAMQRFMEMSYNATSHELAGELKRLVRRHFTDSWCTQAAVNMAQITSDRTPGGQPFETESTGVRACGVAGLVRELALSPSFRAAEHWPAFVAGATAVADRGHQALESTITSGPVGWRAVVLLDQLLAELVAAGAFADTRQAAEVVVRTVFKGEQSQDSMLRRGAPTTTAMAKDFILAFESHGVSRKTINDLLEHLDDEANEAFVEAARMMCTEMSMTSVISESLSQAEPVRATAIGRRRAV